MDQPSTTDDTVRLILAIVAALVLAPILLLLVSLPMMGMWGGMMGGVGGQMGGGYFGSGLSPLWGLVTVVIWLVIIGGGGYLFYRWMVRHGGFGGDPALQALRLAYARGELTEEEYESRRERLDGE